jgi:hypothetical protein
MDSEIRRIPKIQIENIGSKKNPQKMIKGYIELPCWNGYYLYDDTYTLKKTKLSQVDVLIYGWTARLHQKATCTFHKSR